MVKNNQFDDGFSELIPTPPSAGIGHNRGPEWLPVGGDLEQKLLQAHTKILDRAQELRSKVGAFKAVGNPAQLKRVTEYVAQLQTVMTELKAAADLEKSPYNVALGQIRGVLGDPFDAVEAIKRATESLMNTYNAQVIREERRKRDAELAKKRAEEDAARRIQAAKDLAARKAREEAQRKIDAAAAKAAEAKKPPPAAPKAVVRAIAKADAAEAEANHARDQVDDARADVTRAERATTARAADLTRARSPNALQSGHEFVDFRDFDKSKIDLEALRNFIAPEHLQTAVRGYIDANNASIKEDIRNRRQPMRGVEFFINLRTVVRK